MKQLFKHLSQRQTTLGLAYWSMPAPVFSNDRNEIKRRVREGWDG
jgi:hypothetical protein